MGSFLISSSISCISISSNSWWPSSLIDNPFNISTIGSTPFAMPPIKRREGLTCVDLKSLVDKKAKNVDRSCKYYNTRVSGLIIYIYIGGDVSRNLVRIVQFYIRFIHTNCCTLVLWIYVYVMCIERTYVRGGQEIRSAHISITRVSPLLLALFFFIFSY